MLLEEHHFTAPQRASPWLLSLSLASRSEDLQWMGGTFSKGPNDNRELVSTLPVTPRSGRNLLRGLADPRGRVGRRVADCESMWRGLWTLVSRAARGPHRWGDLGKGCDSVGRCSGPKPSPWDLGAPFPAARPPFASVQAPPPAAEPTAIQSSGLRTSDQSIPLATKLPLGGSRDHRAIYPPATLASELLRCTDSPLLQSQTVHAPGQWLPGPWFRSHYLRSELWPRPLRHRGDPNQRPCQRPRPPEPHGAAGLTPGPQSLPAPAQRPPFWGAFGPRAGALVSRYGTFRSGTSSSSCDPTSSFQAVAQAVSC